MSQIENSVVRKVKNTASGKKIITQVQISYVVYPEDGVFIAYAPAIEFSTQGETEEQAREMFNEAATELFRELLNDTTLDEFLKSNGWYEINNQYKVYTPPINSPEVKQFQIALA